MRSVGSTNRMSGWPPQRLRALMESCFYVICEAECPNKQFVACRIDRGNAGHSGVRAWKGFAAFFVVSEAKCQKGNSWACHNDRETACPWGVKFF